MSNFDNDLENFGSGKTLNADGDILIYKPCCVFNDDDDGDRRQIARLIRKQINQLVIEAGCDDYSIFLTTKINFRDFLVGDYKENRKDTERPVNLAWAKRWTVKNLDSIWCEGLEADDLLGIYQNDNTVLWSPDKDLRQIPGAHLDDATRKIIQITDAGILEDRGKKAYFTGMTGFYYQCLIGDGADYIVGCGKRVPADTKSGNRRVGIGHKAACQIVFKAALSDKDNQLEAIKKAVAASYYKLHGKNWQKELEIQANLLWMVREQSKDIIKRWTYDGRDEYMNINTGVIITDESY